MAQSYDVYFARMLLTLGLVERGRLQKHLSTFQKNPGERGFPAYLVAESVIDFETSRKVASDLERYLLGRRRKERAAESDRAITAEEVEPAAPASTSARIKRALEPTDEKPEKTEKTGAPTGWGKTKVPSSGRPTPAPISRDELSSESRRKSSAVHKALPDEGTAARDSSSKASGSGERRSSRLPAQPSSSSGSSGSGGSARLKKSSSGEVPVKPPETGRESARLKKASGETPAPKHEAAPAAGQSARLKKASGDAPAPRPAPAAPAGVDRARQRALLDRATKDPLAKLVGRRLGRTELTRLVETTPFVSVFEGKHGDDERPAIVKVLRPDRLKDREAIERFTREAKSLEKIDHPDIARVFETGEAEKVRFLSLEASTGEALGKLLERAGRLPPERVQKIGRGTALALAAAHRAGIVHRDVRPANVFIEEDGTVKITGFGMARDVEVPGRLTATGQITGHPSYVAPEIASGEPVTGKVDVYSLGIVLYLAITGHLPFESTSVVKLVGMQMNSPPPPVLDAAPGCPPRLAALVERLLTKAADKRPEAMEAANLLAAKDLLEGGSDIAEAAAPKAPKADSEEELRRMLAPDEDPLPADDPPSESLGGPSCAACELPLGARATSLHGNSICERCLERVEGLDVCAACFQDLSEIDRDATDTAVFAGHVYCRACTGRVRMACGQCGKPIALADLPKGRAKAKGDSLVHTSCPA